MVGETKCEESKVQYRLVVLALSYLAKFFKNLNTI
jgi:hypothetical protein